MYFSMEKKKSVLASAIDTLLGLLNAMEEIPFNAR